MCKEATSLFLIFMVLYAHQFCVERERQVCPVIFMVLYADQLFCVKREDKFVT